MNDEYRSQDSDQLAPPLDAALQALLSEPLPDDAVERVKLRARQLAAASTTKPQPAAPTTRTTRRSFSRSIVGTALAAAAVLAVMFGLNPWVDRSHGQAFAQILDKVKTAKAVQFAVITQFGKQPEMRSRMYWQQNRIRIEHFDGKLVMIGHPVSKQSSAIYLDTQRKIAQQMEIGSDVNKNFDNPIDQLSALGKGDGESIGEETFQGHPVRVYRVGKTKLLGMSGMEMLLWVDPRTNLPVKIVTRDTDPKSLMEVRFEDFQWDNPLADNMFSVEVPAGFQPGVVVLAPSPRQSTQPKSPSAEPNAAFAQGVISDDRVPGKILWNQQGTTITALMRDPETVSAPDSQPRELRQWEATTGKLRWSERVPGASSFAGTSDGGLLVTVIGYEVQIREGSTGQIKFTTTTEKQLSPLAFSPNGKVLAAGIAEWGPGGKELPGGIQLWNMEASTLTRTIPDDKPIAFVEFSPDGKFVASASNSGPVKLWDVTSGKLVRIFPGFLRATFSPDGELLACPSSDAKSEKTVGVVNVYNLKTGALVRSLTTDKGATASSLLSVNFSSDGKQLVAADWNGMVTVWAADTGERLKTDQLHKAGVHDAEFSPDGSKLATGSEDQTLRLISAPPVAQ